MFLLSLCVAYIWPSSIALYNGSWNECMEIAFSGFYSFFPPWPVEKEKTTPLYVGSTPRAAVVMVSFQKRPPSEQNTILLASRAPFLPIPRAVITRSRNNCRLAFAVTAATLQTPRVCNGSIRHLTAGLRTVKGKQTQRLICKLSNLRWLSTCPCALGWGRFRLHYSL